MRRISRAIRRAPTHRESKTACARGARLRMGWQKFPRPRCRPSRSLWHRTTQAADGVLNYPRLSCRAKSRHLRLLKADNERFLDFARNDTLEKLQIDESLTWLHWPACKS